MVNTGNAVSTTLNLKGFRECWMWQKVSLIVWPGVRLTLSFHLSFFFLPFNLCLCSSSPSFSVLWLWFLFYTHLSIHPVHLMPASDIIFFRIGHHKVIDWQGDSAYRHDRQLGGPWHRWYRIGPLDQFSCFLIICFTHDWQSSSQMVKGWLTLNKTSFFFAFYSCATEKPVCHRTSRRGRPGIKHTVSLLLHFLWKY